MNNGVLIISHDRIAGRMAGPAIRCLEFARVLGAHIAVTLAAPEGSGIPAIDGVSVHLFDYGDEQLLALAGRSRAVVLSGLTLAQFPQLAQLGVPLALDIYAPFNLENLEYLLARPPAERPADHNNVLNLLAYQLRRADFFICANERQRDYWLGLLSALNRVNPLTYAQDHTLRSLIDVVPFGLPAEPPRHTRPALKGAYPGINAADRVILWGGGIYQWFDPLTLIRAVGQIAPARPEVKLFFMGTKHPNPHVRGFDKMKQAIALSKDLGLHNRRVFFNDWTPYEARHNYLLEADIGASLHLEHLETRYSFRTRMLDYIWAGLPILATGGDAMAELVAGNGLGRVVAPQDVAGVAEALLALLAEPDLKAKTRPQFERLAAQLAWPVVAQPLVNFCLSPAPAADRLPQTGSAYPPPLGPAADTPPPVVAASWRGRLVKAWQLWRNYGFRALAREARSYLRWRQSRR